MKFKKSITAIFLTALAAMTVIGCSDDDSNPVLSPSATTSVRVIHTSYDAPAVDIAVDGAKAITSLSYGISSGYAEIGAGMRQIDVTPAGATSPVVIGASLDFNVDQSYTVYAVNNLDNITAVVSVDDRTSLSDKARIRFLHASPDAPAVDIRLNDGNGAAVFGNAAFTDISDYVPVNGGTYTFAVTAAGQNDALLIFDPITVADGGVYTVVAHGSFDNSDSYPFAVRVFVDNDPGDQFVDMSFGTSKVRVVHASPDAPGVDLKVDMVTVNSAALTFPNFTDYLDVNAGSRNLMVSASGGGPTVIDATVPFSLGGAYTIFAVDELANIEPLVLSDNLATPASGIAHIRFVHLSPDAPAVDITTGNGSVTLFNDVAFKGSVDFTPVAAGTYPIEVRDASGSTVVLDLGNITLADGMIYTVYAHGFLSSLSAGIITYN